MGNIAPHDGTAGPYRRHRMKVDKLLSEQKENSIFNRYLKKK
jgi:hypothetical protein